MKIFQAYYKNQFIWVRIFGYGLKIKNTNLHPLLFSERTLNHGLQIGIYRIGFLPKSKI